jgi:hypothetical protein
MCVRLLRPGAFDTRMVRFRRMFNRGLLANSHFCKTTSLGAATLSLMTLNPCINLSFDGQCEAAFKFYERRYRKRSRRSVLACSRIASASLG